MTNEGACTDRFGRLRCQQLGGHWEDHRYSWRWGFATFELTWAQHPPGHRRSHLEVACSLIAVLTLVAFTALIIAGWAS